MNLTRENGKDHVPLPNPVAKASFLSKRTFWYLRSLYRTGLKRPIEEEDVYDTLNEHKSEAINDLFSKEWAKECESNKSPHLLRVIGRIYGMAVLSWGVVYSIVDCISRVMVPLCLGGLVTYFGPNQTHTTKDDAYMYAAGIVIFTLSSVITYHPFIFYIYQTGMKIRVGSSTLIYQKIFQLSKSTTFDGINGQLINLLSNDIGKLDIGLSFVHDLWKGPLEAIVMLYFIYREIGMASIIGMVFMFCFIPIQAYVGKMAASYRLKTAKRTDTRVKFMNEIIQAIQVIKMYTWENSFADMVDKIRKKETKAIRGTLFLQATMNSFAIISRFSLFLSLVAYVYFGNIITARKVFIVSSFYSALHIDFVRYWPKAITTCAEAFVSTCRITKFLLRDDEHLERNQIKHQDKLKFKITGIVDDKPKTKPNGLEEVHELLPKRINTKTESEPISVQMKNVSASWNIFEKLSSFEIESVDFDLQSGTLCSIVGPVGSGKSTLLNLLIGELEVEDGSVQINGTISYASQEPWLFEASIRQNIVFVEEFNEKRYYEVIKVCALERDIKDLPYGDLTIVGERGVCLSGGQKARINLARAVYKQADVYFLDDPLSAVDTHVGKHIFDLCLRKYLRDKLVILVTHQLQVLKDVDHIIVMNSGRIATQGNFKAIKNSKFLDSLKEEQHEDENGGEKRRSRTSSQSDSIHQFDNDIEPVEHREVNAAGTVKFDVYKSYFKSVQSLPFIIFVFIIFILGQIATSCTDFFISMWVNWEESLIIERPLNDTVTEIQKIINDSANLLTSSKISVDQFGDDGNTEQRINYVIVYTILISTVLIFVVQRSFGFFMLTLKASVNLHDKLFRGIIKATMGFFNINPSGRILNRFAKDIGAIDTILPINMAEVIILLFELLSVLIIVSIVNFWLLLPTFIMLIMLQCFRVIYMNTSRCVKRVEAQTRSPVYSHANATLQGLSTIRMAQAHKLLHREFCHHLDRNSSAWLMYIATTRSFALWLDITCSIYIGLVAFSFLVLNIETSGGNVGLTISQVMSMIGMCQWGMRQFAEMENQMTSVERVLEYANLKSEPPLDTEPEFRPYTDWPDKGAIKFANVNLRYSEEGDLVLKDLTFQIQPNEKVGIVGRTGAGKSSIIQALFRLNPVEGVIEIDGINTQTLGLHDVRSKISIIPQDPVLFAGTLRSNLDPFEKRSDDELWKALDSVELKTVVQEGMIGGLNCKISDGGSNFSMGQRQLICLARAILCNNRILILDEATANVDPETDKLIQNTIRDNFARCTVLTIAHRLHTVMDSDKVLVMDAGRLVEFGHPFELIERRGFFRSLIDQTGLATSITLIEIARDRYNNFNT